MRRDLDKRGRQNGWPALRLPGRGGAAGLMVSGRPAALALALSLLCTPVGLSVQIIMYTDLVQPPAGAVIVMLDVCSSKEHEQDRCLPGCPERRAAIERAVSDGTLCQSQDRVPKDPFQDPPVHPPPGLSHEQGRKNGCAIPNCIV